MKPNITVQEAINKEIELPSNIRKLLMDFKVETGFYVESIHLDYYSSFAEKNAVVIVDVTSRINS